ncbi:hypothetical protein [Nocardioides halotolerans]|uniref:hypothetical protein n=1 Tax=Nocardioides halotolerans TaxID=433660 RepID=UPI000404DABE|nr:hypothetical protein [Nocardioides halotolerans]
MDRLPRVLAALALVLAGAQLLGAPSTAATAPAQRTDPVDLVPSATSVPFGRSVVLTATVASPQPDSRLDVFARSDGATRSVGTATPGGGGEARLSVTVNRTATYWAVLTVAGVVAAQSASVPVVVAPLLKLTATRVIGPVYHFTATVQPADGVPVVLQRLVGKRWKKIGKDVAEDGEHVFRAEIPADTTSKWRLLVRGGKKWGAATSKAVRVTDY